MIASDIHGSGYHCEKVISRFAAEKSDKLLLLGDLLYHGPRNDLPEGYDTKETVRILNSVKDSVICVRGNCDAEVDQMVLDFSITDTFKVLEIDGYVFFASHGHIYNTGHLPPLEGIDVILNGHTHIYGLIDQGDYYYVNPGSATLPKGGTTNSYIIYENGVFKIKDLEGNEISKMKIEKTEK